MGIDYLGFIHKDLSCVEKTLIAEICKRAGTSQKQVLLVHVGISTLRNILTD